MENETGFLNSWRSKKPTKKSANINKEKKEEEPKEKTITIKTSRTVDPYIIKFSYIHNI